MDCHHAFWHAMQVHMCRGCDCCPILQNANLASSFIQLRPYGAAHGFLLARYEHALVPYDLHSLRMQEAQHQRTCRRSPSQRGATGGKGTLASR